MNANNVAVRLISVLIALRRRSTKSKQRVINDQISETLNDDCKIFLDISGVNQALTSHFFTSDISLSNITKDNFFFKAYIQRQS